MNTHTIKTDGKSYILVIGKGMLAAIFSIFALLAGYASMQATEAVADKVSCAAFSSWEDAQAHYQKSLDRDNDGEACDNMKRKWK